MEQRQINVDLSGKVALITGAARGIGKAIAVAFADNGAKVVIADIDIDEAQKTAKEIGPQAVAVKVDLVDPASIEKLFDEAEAACGATIDILANNAGAQLTLEPVENMPLDIWNKVFALNLTSAMLCCKRVIPGMKKNGWGRIINTSSISSLSGGGPGGTSYASSKGAMSTLTRGLAKEVGKDGITVNAIAPGVILTRIHEEFSTKESLASLLTMTPVGRHGQPEDVAGTALFLASDSAAFITGEHISVNGGLRMV